MRVFTTFLLIFIAGILFTLSFFNEEVTEEVQSGNKVEKSQEIEEEKKESYVGEVNETASEVIQETEKSLESSEKQIDEVVKQVQQIQEESEEDIEQIIDEAIQDIEDSAEVLE